MNVSAILLAAGESSRMGQPKQTLPWQGKPLLTYQVEQLLASPVSEVLVVLGHRADDFRPLVPRSKRVRVLVNDAWAQGKSTSLKLGVRQAILAADAYLILTVDQPRTAPMLRRLLSEHTRRQATLSALSFKGKGGHPLVASATLRDELLAISEERRGLHEVVERYLKELVLVGARSELALVNLNTPEDYQKAYERWGRRAAQTLSLDMTGLARGS